MISQLVTGQHCVIRVRGELDAHCVFELRDRVTRAFANYGSIQVDLSEVKTLDTAGRSMLDFLRSIASPMFRVTPPGTQFEETECSMPFSTKSSH
ncbi:MAG: anti-sigma factor antagonist [Thermomicrobiales bacterium]|jgi:anti-anti-sigma factor|nr:MAG: anti-sigma factor antagonist [Thermomicrobiales bacterium]